MILALARAERTAALGEALARALPAPAASPPAGAHLHLSGALGCGKTTLVRAMLRALGITATVRSPTYTLIELYCAAGWQVAHFDLFRIGDAEELELLGARDHFVAGTLCCVEWPERAGGWLPPPDLSVTLEVAGAGRRAHLAARRGFGESWLAAALENLK